jgi:drug/metabolite transporter (DMT)-like permease
MRTTPMAYVSGLRETSVILAAIIGTRLLGEPFGRERVTAACLVAGGIGLLKIAS